MIHKFEEAGLGIAPFKVVGIATIPSPALAEQNPDAYNNRLRDIPAGYGCGSCAFCGMPLMNNFLIKSADGHRFSVGCECVRKTGDAGMVDKVKAMKKEAERLKKHENREAKRLALLKAERDRNGGFTDFEFNDAHRLNRAFDANIKNRKRAEILKPLADRLRDYKQGFCDSVSDGLERGEIPFGRGCDIMIDILAKQAGRRNSKAYDSEYDVIANLIETAEAI
jgi:hypothetical protein